MASAPATTEEKGLTRVSRCSFVLCLRPKISFLICNLVIRFLCVCFKIFEQFVKTRIKEEYKEKKSKLLLAKEEFRKLLEESKVSPRYRDRNQHQAISRAGNLPAFVRGRLQPVSVKLRALTCPRHHKCNSEDPLGREARLLPCWGE